MSITKKVTKLTNTDAVVHLYNSTGNDSTTIDLQTELKMPNETLGAEQSVYITSAKYSSGGHIHVKRGDDVAYVFYGDGQILDAEFVSKMNPTADITVEFDAKGMAILHVKKVAGYNNPIETGVYGSYDNPSVVGS